MLPKTTLQNRTATRIMLEQILVHSHLANIVSIRAQSLATFVLQGRFHPFPNCRRFRSSQRSLQIGCGRLHRPGQNWIVLHKDQERGLHQTRRVRRSVHGRLGFRVRGTGRNAQVRQKFLLDRLRHNVAIVPHDTGKIRQTPFPQSLTRLGLHLGANGVEPDLLRVLFFRAGAFQVVKGLQVGGSRDSEESSVEYQGRDIVLAQLLLQPNVKILLHFCRHPFGFVYDSFLRVLLLLRAFLLFLLGSHPTDPRLRRSHQAFSIFQQHLVVVLLS